MNREEARKKVIEIKRLALEKEKRELEKKAELFNNWPGKILKSIAWIVIILSGLLITDGVLEPTYKDYKIVDAKSEYIDLVRSDGHGIHAKYFHVYLNEAKSFEVFIYMYEYYLAKKRNIVEIGSTPIFKAPKKIRVGAENKISEKKLEYNIGLRMGLPIFFIVLGVSVLLINFKHNSQTIAYGHLSFLIMPAALITLLVLSIGGFFPSGQYEMDLEDFQARHLEEVEEVKSWSGVVNED